MGERKRQNRDGIYTTTNITSGCVKTTQFSDQKRGGQIMQIRKKRERMERERERERAIYNQYTYTTNTKQLILFDIIGIT